MDGRTDRRTVRQTGIKPIVPSGYTGRGLKIDNHNVHPVITNWFISFLSNRQQLVKIHADTRSNGGVPKGTLCDPELFIHMVANLQTCVPQVEFIDDTTFIEICA
jgi:hypothetical protein